MTRIHCRRIPAAFLLYASFPVAGLTRGAEPVAQADTSIETVVVTARALKRGILAENALNPGGVTLIDAESLHERNVSNLADFLRYAPGVWSASSAGADSMFFSSRGSNLDATDYDMNGIKLLQDGLPVTGADGNNHNRMLDPLSARFANVARGANALTFGASTLGGAIDFVSPTARNNAPRELAVNGGSHGKGSERVTAGGVSGSIDGLVTLEAKQWDGYRDHNNQERYGFYGNAGWQLSESVANRLFLTRVDNEQELPGGLREDQVEDDPDQASVPALGGNYQINVETWRVADKTTWNIDEDSSFEFGVSYEEQDLYHPIVDKILVDFDGPGGNDPVEVFSLLVDTESRNFGTMLRYRMRRGAHDVVAGVDYGNLREEGGDYRNDGGRRNGQSTEVANSAVGLQAFVVDRWQIDPQWTLVYGLQGVKANRDVHTVESDSGDVNNPVDDYSSLNPRVGVIYELNSSMGLFANVSRIYEPPTNFELSDDFSNATNPNAANETLDAMQGTVVEIGTRGTQTIGEASHWSWEVALYQAWIEDEILSVELPVGSGNSVSKNVDDTIHAGVEALISASFALDAGGAQRIEPVLSVTLNAFSFDGDAVYGDNELPAAPEYVVRGEILYRRASGFFAGPSFDLVGERYADFSNTYSIDSYALLGLRAGFARKSWQVFAEIRNLLDEDYIATHSVLDTAAPDAAILYPGEPRSAYAGVQLQF